jgi:hypothetical protein
VIKSRIMFSFDNFKLLSRLRIAKKTLWLNSNFYILVNPDVAASRMNPRIHYFRYGFYENRVYRITQCELLILQKLEIKQSYKLLSSFFVNEYIKFIRSVFIINLPWRFGCYGFPSKLLQIDIKGNIKVDSQFFSKINQNYYSTYNLYRNTTSLFLIVE